MPWLMHQLLKHFHLMAAIFNVLFTKFQTTMVRLNKIGNHPYSTRRAAHELKRSASHIPQDYNCFKWRKKTPTSISSHNKPWDMKYTIPSWRESTLFLFKIMCFFEKVIHMIASDARSPFYRYSEAPYYLAYTAKNFHQVCFDSDS